MTQDQIDLNDSMKLIAYAIGFISGLRFQDIRENIEIEKIEIVIKTLEDGVDKIMKKG